MTNPDLPPGVKPGDSDPPKQKALSGRLVFEMTVRGTYDVQPPIVCACLVLVGLALIVECVT